MGLAVRHQASSSMVRSTTTPGVSCEEILQDLNLSLFASVDLHRQPCLDDHHPAIASVGCICRGEAPCLFRQQMLHQPCDLLASQGHPEKLLPSDPPHRPDTAFWRGPRSFASHAGLKCPSQKATQGTLSLNDRGCQRACEIKASVKNKAAMKPGNYTQDHQYQPTRAELRGDVCTPPPARAIPALRIAESVN